MNRLLPFCLLLMRSLHDMHEMNANRVDHVSVRTFQFPTISNTNMADEQTSEVGSRLAPLAFGKYNYTEFSETHADDFRGRFLD
jgi:hypothetical protein